MKSKLLAIALSMFCISLVSANDTVDANRLATGTVVEVSADEATKEVAAEEAVKEEALKAKKVEETKAVQEKSCAECK